MDERILVLTIIPCTPLSVCLNDKFEIARRSSVRPFRGCQGYLRRPQCGSFHPGLRLSVARQPIRSPNRGLVMTSRLLFGIAAATLAGLIWISVDDREAAPEPRNDSRIERPLSEVEGRPPRAATPHARCEVRAACRRATGARPAARTRHLLSPPRLNRSAHTSSVSGRAHRLTPDARAVNRRSHRLHSSRRTNRQRPAVRSRHPTRNVHGRAASADRCWKKAARLSRACRLA